VQSRFALSCTIFFSERQLTVFSKLPKTSNRSKRLVTKLLIAGYSSNLLSLSALLITETELNVIATLAITGLSKTPNKG
jgi:hypothetical protein